MNHTTSTTAVDEQRMETNIPKLSQSFGHNQPSHTIFASEANTPHHETGPVQYYEGGTLPNPFQIDSNPQFTFSIPHNASTLRTTYSPATHTYDTGHYPESLSDNFKRRFTPSDFSFMGRSLSNMNIDAWCEPPHKRGRSKRED
ncbi:hypothetical protein BDF14DRAFT_1747715 [Spinellus fusiger]|nr:hypothetical protein BDF14DRAFT_1747715 [Spinellus fusiger]